eukprot:c16666_g1_i2 orf=307-825(+)
MCFKVWRGTPFPRINMWNWRVMTGTLLTGEKLRSWAEISGLCPWCKAAKESSLHLFWSCPAVRRFWGKMNSKLKQIFGNVKLSAHMVLLGTIRDHSAEFCFMWQLCRAVATETLWKERNKYMFQGGKADISDQQAISCLFKTVMLLKNWTEKGKIGARKIADMFYEMLIEVG